MKGFLKYLSPFAPDQSGAVSVLYGLGGLIVICDAGGCTGNICGFDEPRWFLEEDTQKSAIFSAGLRDMDAILGRDERLVEKLADAAEHLDASFAALIGTPVPAVIATDFEALGRMAEEQTGLPVLTAECTGTRLYDEGEQEVYLDLFRTFADKSAAAGENVLGVIGCTPLDLSRLNADEIMQRYAKEHGFSRACCYGMGAGLEEIKRAGCAAKNLVVSPAGIRAAKYLKETFGTPYEMGYPFLTEAVLNRLKSPGGSFEGQKILIVHQQAAANEIRRILSGGADDERIVCGTWFLQIPELARPQDVRFEREEQFASFVEEGGFDVIIGDPKLKRVIGNWSGTYINCPHYAVSGTLEEGLL